MNFWLHVDDWHVRVTSDMFSGNDNKYNIDANFLYNLENGEEYLQLLTKIPVPILEGLDEQSCSILGKITLLCPVEVDCHNYYVDYDVQWESELDFIVVDYLVSKVHIAVDYQAFY